MNKITAVIRTAFLGFVFGFIASVLLERWLWLSMRLNLAAAIPIGAATGALVAAFLKPPRKLWWFIVSEIFLLVIMAVLFRSDAGAWAVLPGIMFRGGFGLNSLSLTQANLVLILFALAGNAVWLVSSRRDSLPKK